MLLEHSSLFLETSATQAKRQAGGVARTEASKDKYTAFMVSGKDQMFGTLLNTWRARVCAESAYQVLFLARNKPVFDLVATST